jgi:hypothetical protein
MGRLLWIGEHLLSRELGFTLRVHTGDGLHKWQVRSRKELSAAVDSLLHAQIAREGDVRQGEGISGWQYHIGGEPV